MEDCEDGVMSKYLGLVEQIERDLAEKEYQDKELVRLTRLQADTIQFKWCPDCPYYKNCYDWDAGYPGPFCLEPGCAEPKE